MATTSTFLVFLYWRIMCIDFSYLHFRNKN